MQNKKHSLEFEKPLLELERQLEELMQSSQDSDLDFSDEIKGIEKKIELTKKGVYSDLDALAKGSAFETPQSAVRFGLH